MPATAPVMIGHPVVTTVAATHKPGMDVRDWIFVIALCVVVLAAFQTWQFLTRPIKTAEVQADTTEPATYAPVPAPVPGRDYDAADGDYLIDPKF